MSTATLIDHIIGSTMLPATKVTQISGISDHRIQVADFSISLLKATPRHIWIRFYKKFKWQDLKAALISVP